MTDTQTVMRAARAIAQHLGPYPFDEMPKHRRMARDWFRSRRVMEPNLATQADAIEIATAALSALPDLSRLEGECERLRKALEPFAELAVNFVSEDDDDFDAYRPPAYETQKQVLVGWLREAAQGSGDEG